MAKDESADKKSPQAEKHPKDLTPAERRQILTDYVDKRRDNIDAAEREAAKVVQVHNQIPLLAIGMMGIVMSIFFPHSGQVKGIDVLFFTPIAEAMVTTMPERIYIWLALVGGVFFTLGTIFTRQSLIAWLNWFLSGIGMAFSMFAIWMRMSRPPTEPGVGPSFGLIMGAVSSVIIFVTITTIVLRRSPLQIMLATARQEEANRTEEARFAQQRLRVGIKNPGEQNSAFEDDRRARARERAHRIAQNQKGDVNETGHTTGADTAGEQTASSESAESPDSRGAQGTDQAK